MTKLKMTKLKKTRQLKQTRQLKLTYPLNNSRFISKKINASTIILVKLESRSK